MYASKQNKTSSTDTKLGLKESGYVTLLCTNNKKDNVIRHQKVNIRIPARGVRGRAFQLPDPYPYPTRAENCYPTRPDPRVYP